MPGLFRVIVIGLLALQACCNIEIRRPALQTSCLSPPLSHLVQDIDKPLSQLVQELVQAQSRLVHDIARHQPSLEINPALSSSIQDVDRHQLPVDVNHDTKEDQGKGTSLIQGVAQPQHFQPLDDHHGEQATTNIELGNHDGPQGLDSSQQGSGFYIMDTEETEKEREIKEIRVVEEIEDKDHLSNQPDAREDNHTTLDLDSLIGYSSSFFQTSSSPLVETQQPNLSSLAPVPETGELMEQGSPVLDVGHFERDLWEGEGEDEGQASGYGLGQRHTTTSPGAVGAPRSTIPSLVLDPILGLVEHRKKDTSAHLEVEREEKEQAEEETEDEDLRYANLDMLTQNPTAPEVGVAPSREPLQPSHAQPFDMEEERGLEEAGEDEENGGPRESAGYIGPLTTGPTPSLAPTVGYVPWDWQDQATPPQEEGSEVRGGGVTELLLPEVDVDETQEDQQVVCVDWSELSGRGYVILNMTDNMNCEEFRAERGMRLLEVLERVFSRRMNSPQGSWLLSLSKPTHHQHQLLMTLASEHGVIATKDVLSMLGEIKKGLHEVGIQNYSAASTCHSRPGQTRSDYGKLFVVLVIIGSVCTVIITSGLIYICWQKRLPGSKTMSRAEELNFVENGCHDNPTLDVTNDSKPEMQEKKPSTNGLAGGRAGGGEDGNRWQVFVNQPGVDDEEEEDEQDTHL